MVIYDTTGVILAMSTGNVYRPVGVPCMDVEIPAGKQLVRIDTTVTPNVPVFEDMPIPDVLQLRADIDYVAMMGGITL